VVVTAGSLQLPVENEPELTQVVKTGHGIGGRLENSDLITPLEKFVVELLGNKSLYLGKKLLDIQRLGEKTVGADLGALDIFQLRGVRSSFDIWARNSPLIWFASKRRSLARSKSSVRSLT
jgi:hypothetical protein